MSSASSRQVIAQGQRDHDPQPEERGDADDRGEPVAVLDVHEEQDDQDGLGRGDRHGDREMQAAQRKIGGPDRREQQDQERDEDRDVGLDRGNVLLHGWTSIR